MSIARDRPRRTSWQRRHGVAVFRRCDAADRTGGLPDSRCGLSDTAAAPREHKKRLGCCTSSPQYWDCC